MYLNLYQLVGIVVVCTIILSAIFLFKNRRTRIIKTSGAALTCEELEMHARKIAIEHSLDKRKGGTVPLFQSMNDNYNYIRSLYISLNEDVEGKKSVPPAAEWLLDNFYIIEEQVKGIRRDMTKTEYSRLPVLKCGNLQGVARIYAVAAELAVHTDGQINENTIVNYLNAYQLQSTLYDREIWALPTMIRLALIEDIRNLCIKIRETRHQWGLADEITENWLNDEGADAGKIIKSIESKFKAMEEIHPSFIEHLAYRLRRARRGYTQILRYIDEHLARYGVSLEDINQKEHNSQSVSTVSMGNCINSLRFLATLNWVDIFETTSSTEQILRRDPDGTYPRMDFTSRSDYRRRVEELAAAYNVSELHVAREAVRYAEDASKIADNTDESKRDNDESSYRRDCHVGYYLIGGGRETLEKGLGQRVKGFSKGSGLETRHSSLLYLGAIILITLILSALAANYAFNAAGRYAAAYAILAALAVLLPASEIAVNVVNWVVCNVKKPALFPKLELKEGIPEDLRTMIVIPALLPDEKRVKELLENLETHYLANKEDNLYFALLGDFKDSMDASLPEDKKIVDAGLAGIKELNARYPGKDHDRFYYFHRERKLNASHKKWMGWERKRGALLEFNDLLLGSRNTSFKYFSAFLPPAAEIKYVITLDADTVLPIAMARKMIGTIAHPLHRAVIDKKKGIVAEGYGLIQPRISFDVESANKSLFSRIFTGQEGLDPYASAVSDIYQDLFCEGIFTGKGIYDLKVFQNVLKNAIPENSVLSHDLLEGSYIRVGLATDLELVDSYPSRYNSYAARLHRWVRGDWQLLPWLRSKVRDRKGNLVKNPLTLISKWKIFDNLRRSLLSLSLMLLIALGLSILPGSSILWLTLAVLTLVFPLITASFSCLLSGHLLKSRIKRHIPVISGLKAAALQVVLTFIFLPYQAYLLTHAAIVSLVRVLISRKNMLEWVTAADVEKGQKNSLKSFWMKMRIAAVEAGIIVILAFVFRPTALGSSLFLFIIWGASPWVAYRVSKVYEAVPYRPTDENLEELRLIARKTWRYFEEFANFRNHYLAPDNYQEDPPRGVAHRTSPTNIGLGMLAVLSARDLGYLGIQEMTELLSKTMATIDQMEKWNGHLYNWYDTRTLEPLRPRYISTVDSGNFVCYLETLSQGLKDYLNQPLVDTRFIDGMKDTFTLMGKEGIEIYEKTGYFREGSNKSSIDIVSWNRALNEVLKSLQALDM
ncbi:MAG: DUF3131 domain-containing protein, partial [Clostridia bacterium]|nr:DUF3131 domain-containing protein [Clostridia bacterium]